MQMTAFKEVFRFHLGTNHKVNLMKKASIQMFSVFRDSLS